MSEKTELRCFCFGEEGDGCSCFIEKKRNKKARAVYRKLREGEPSGSVDGRFTFLTTFDSDVSFL